MVMVSALYWQPTGRLIAQADRLGLNSVGPCVTKIFFVPVVC